MDRKRRCKAKDTGGMTSQVDKEGQPAREQPARRTDIPTGRRTEELQPQETSTVEAKGRFS